MQHSTPSRQLVKGSIKKKDTNRNLFSAPSKETPKKTLSLPISLKGESEPHSYVYISVLHSFNLISYKHVLFIIKYKMYSLICTHIYY